MQCETLSADIVCRRRRRATGPGARKHPEQSAPVKEKGCRPSCAPDA